jgi:3-dehydroquinate dehydratase II
MTILVLNGPNVSLIGIRQPGIYGHESVHAAMERMAIRSEKEKIELEIMNSNHEGDLVDRLHQSVTDPSHSPLDAIITNPGGATPYSLSLRDALLAVARPTVLVHVSNPAARTDGEVRQIDLIAPVCDGVISGLGVFGYELALEWCIRELAK